MKTVIKSAALFGAVSLLAACGGEENSDHSVDINYHDIKATLQGVVFNGIDGKRITDESLQVTLVQGTDYRKAQVRTGDKDYAGDYAINSIPASTANNNTYRIVATADGFQTFETAVSFGVNTAGLQDKSVNLMGNMYMYPLGSFANDVKVNVTYNNEPVVGASVYLNPEAGSNTLTTDSSNILFAPQDGFQPALKAVTDANGVVTFSGENLVLGGEYSIEAMPIIHNGTQLIKTSIASIQIGTDDEIQNIDMNSTSFGNNNGLYVTSASNLTDSITTSGALTLTFSRAVSFVNEENITATLINDTTAVLDGTDSVTGTLSTDGKTLTLTPKFSTAPVVWTGSNDVTADNGLEVTFANAWVRIVGAANSSTAYDVFALTAETGGNPDDTVQVTETF